MTLIDTRDLLTELDTLLDRRDDEEQSDPLTDEECERLQALVTVRDQIGPEFDYGVTMVPEDAFRDYARDLAEDIDAVPSDLPWPLVHIDWDAAAAALRSDFTEIDLGGRTYLVQV